MNSMTDDSAAAGPLSWAFRSRHVERPLLLQRDCQTPFCHPSQSANRAGGHRDGVTRRTVEAQVGAGAAACQMRHRWSRSANHRAQAAPMGAR